MDNSFKIINILSYPANPIITLSQSIYLDLSKLRGLYDDPSPRGALESPHVA